jgi:hypothetical protein
MIIKWRAWDQRGRKVDGAERDQHLVRVRARVGARARVRARVRVWVWVWVRVRVRERVGEERLVDARLQRLGLGVG